MSEQPESLDGLRKMVREALGDLLPEIARSLPAPDPALRGASDAEPAGRVETVVIRTDADLASFVGRLLRLFEDPKEREDLRSGRLRYCLGREGAPDTARPVRRVEKGAVTEAAVKEAARSGASIVLGPQAVLTPLGRDRARAEGVHVEKEH